MFRSTQFRNVISNFLFSLSIPFKDVMQSCFFGYIVGLLVIDRGIARDSGSDSLRLDLDYL